MPLLVRHLDGPFEGQTQTFGDEIESILIGRDPETCQIVLPPDARMAGREHCTLARVRSKYLIDMDADRRVTLDGGQLLERGSPLPDSCVLQIGPDGPRLKLLTTRHSKMASTADQEIDGTEIARRASRAASELEVQEVAEQAGSSRRIGTAAGVIAVLAVIVAGIVFLVMQSDVEELQVADAEQEGAIENLEGRTDEIEDDLIVLGADLPEIMAAARESVYLVVFRGAEGGETGIGTAFVVAPDTLATNAHVAAWHDRLGENETLLLRSAAEDGADPTDIIVSGTTPHPGYAAFSELWRDYVPVRLNASKGIDPVRSAGSACDLALLTVPATTQLGPPLPMASVAHQAALTPGHAVASVGFPMEGMAMEGVNVLRPVPQSQIGRVTALTTFFNTSENESETGPGQRNILLQHSIPGTGGASGSPIINGAGEVIGVLSAVNFAIVDGQRIPTGVGVNYAQRSTLLEELLQGKAATRLAERLAGWGQAVQKLYQSNRLVRGTGGLDTVVAVWRRQIQDKVGPDQVVLTKRRALEFFPLSSLEAGREVGGDDETGFITEVPIDVEQDGWYLFVVESDGPVVADIDDPDRVAAGINYIPLGDGVQGVAFRGQKNGQVTGLIESDGADQIIYAIEEGDSAIDIPDNVLRLARDQWRDDLNTRWGTSVRDEGGLHASAATGAITPSTRFYGNEPISINSYGRYMIAVVAPERENVDLKLYRLDGENRELLAEDVQSDWYPYLVIDTDFAIELEAEVISDEPETDYEVYVYRAIISGDTDQDDKVLVPDLVNVMLQFGDVADEGESLSSDVNDNGAVDVGDLLAVIGNFNDTWPLEAREQPKRLIVFEIIGGSYPRGQGVQDIAPSNFTLEDGWQAIIDWKLSVLVDSLGDGAFDWWGHNICGYWRDHDYYWNQVDDPAPMIFDQLRFARELYPSLADFTALRNFADSHDIKLYGYIGQPRSYVRNGTPCGMPFDTNWEHGDLDAFDTYYAEFVENGFIGIGHDASVHNPADSPWLLNMVPELKSRGIDIFVESLPKRVNPHLLGYNVVAEHKVWESFRRYPETFYTEDEIREAGGRRLYMMTWPFNQAPGDSDYDPDFNVHDWRFNTTKELLLAGETVLCPLYGLHWRGYPLEELVAAAQQTANVVIE
ncbi:MAG: trypsin-like peptidase domain-containing protein [Phycisphaerales bacterium]|nr:trypsin-like peptidase domain-containing protein [Phycisphaerales bacterium]